MGMTKRILLIVLIVLLVAGAYYGITLRSIHTYQVEYTELPRDDAELQTWLSAQPGVKVIQIQRDGRILHVQYTTPWWHSATALDILGHLESKGYKDRQGFASNYHPVWW